MRRGLNYILAVLAFSQALPAGVGFAPEGESWAIDTTFYNNYRRTMRKVDSLVAMRPGIASVETIAITATGGRAVVAVKLTGSLSSSGQAPSVLFDGAHHGCEVVSSEICLKLLANLIAGYDSSATLKRYIDSLRIFIVPLVNPDGHEVNFVTPDTLWRKNTRDNNRNGYFDSDDGVDLNRNYPFNWEIGGSPDSSDREYRGPYALSEVETQGMAALCAREKFITNICYHSSREASDWEKIYYPWDWGGVRSPDYDIIRPMATSLAASIPNLAGTGSYTASIGNALSGGMYRNWSYYNYGVFSFTLETGIYYPSAAAAESICRNNIAGARNLLNRCMGSVVWGRVTDSADGKPLAAQVLLLELDTLSPLPILPRRSDSAYGRFYRIVNPGTYNFRVSRPGYVTKTASVVVLDGQRSTLEVRLAKPSVTVVSPNGGENWSGGTGQVIKWRRADAGFASYRILLSRNGGSTYPDTIARNVAVTETTYNWILPWITSAACRVMVQALDSTGAFICEDASDGNFSIQTAVTVVSPNGGEILGGGVTHIVRWRTVGVGFGRFRVLLSTNGGSSFADTIAHSVASTESTLAWTPAWMNISTCRIRVQALDSNGTVVVQDGSDANFAVQTSLTVVSPNGGEFWASGGHRTVKWRRMGAGFSRYRLMVSVDGGLTYADTIAQIVNPGESTFVWVVPAVTSSTCWLLAQALDSSGAVICQDASDGSFTIAGVLTVLAPNGGEIWAGSSTQTIRWWKANSAFNHYRLLFSRDGGLTYPDTIVHYVAGTETSYKWVVPPVNSGACRIRVQMVDVAGLVVAADPSDQNFTVDSDPPSGFSLVRPANSAWAGGTPTFTWRGATDNFGIAYYRLYIDGSLRLDTVTDTTCTLSPPPIGEGLRTWSVRAVDRAGNSRQSTQAFSIRIDTTMPGPFSLLSPAESIWTRNLSPTFSWQASYDLGCGLAGYQLWIDGVCNRPDVPSGQTTAAPAANLSLGAHTWQVRALDSVGNTRVSTQTRVFGVDTTPPESFAPALPDDSVWVSGRPGFVWRRATDSLSGTWFYRVYVDGAVRADSIRPPDTSAVPAVSLTEGLKQWYVQAFDRAGNSRSTLTRRIIVDTTAPVSFGLVAPLDGAYSTVPLPVLSWRKTGDAGSGFRKCELWIDGARNKDSLSLLDTVTVPAAALAEGPHTWQVRAYDQVGNVRLSDQTRLVTLDWTPPDTFSLRFPRDNDTTYVQQPVLYWRPSRDAVSGLARYQLLIDGTVSRDSISGSDTCATPATPLAFGSLVQWYVRAVDRAGLERASQQTRSLYVVRDSIAPTVPIQLAPGHGTYCRDSAPVFRWRRSSDTFSGVSHYTLQYAANSSCTTGTTVTVSDTLYQVPVRLADTIWYWRVRAHDRVGNQSDWSPVWSFEVDTRAPAVPVPLRPLRGVWCNSRDVVFGWTAASFGTFSPVRYILQVDTSRSFAYPRTDTTAATEDTLNLAERARYFWRVRAYDLAGNQGGFSSADSFGVDAVLPTVPAPAAPDSGKLLNDSVVRFVWRRSADTLSGVRHYVLQWAPSPGFVGAVTRDSVSDTVFAASPPLADTLWYWRVRAVDRAHNHSAWSAVWYFEKDAAEPMAPVLLEPVQGRWTNTARTIFRWSAVNLMHHSRNTPHALRRTQEFRPDAQGAGREVPPTPFSPVRYIVQVDTLAGFASPLVVDTADFPEDTFELAERQRYFWRVRAFDLAGNQGRFSGTDSFGIDRRVPTAPVPVAPDSGTYLSDSIVRFVWRNAADSLSGVGRYLLQYSRDPTLSDSVTVDSLTDTTFAVVLEDTVLYWRVRAADRAGNHGAWTAVWFFEKDTKAPDQPTLLEPVAGAWKPDSAVRFSWTSVSLRLAVPLSPVRYMLQIDTSPAFARPFVDTLDDTAAIVSRAEGRCYWRVRAFDLAGNQGRFSNADSFGVDLTVPTVPMLEYPPDNATLTDSVFTFIWHYAQDRPSGVAGYRLQVALDTAFARPVQDTVVPDTICRFLLADTVHYWRVRALDRAGNASVWSGRRRLRTAGPGAVAENPAGLLLDALVEVSPVPFRDRLVVDYTLGKTATVRLSLYNAAGTEVALLLSGAQPAGRHRVLWRGGSALSSGVYFVHLDAAAGRFGRKVTRLE